jgi:hypothetical protein
MTGIAFKSAVLVSCFCCMAIALSVPALAASQYVIVASEPASKEFEPGRILNVNDNLEIPEGAVVTLLGEDGSVNAIAGPANVTVTAVSVETSSVAADNTQRDQKRSTLAKLAELLSGERNNADSLGVARSMRARPEPRGLENPWVISIHQDGDGCVRNGKIKLGREDDSQGLSLAVGDDDNSGEHIFNWRKGEVEFLLPETVKAENSQIFVRAGRDRAVIAIHELPGGINLQNPVDVLGWMLDSGCTAQALAFTHQLVSVDSQ